LLPPGLSLLWGYHTNQGERTVHSVIGIPWCREEDYDAFCAIFEDSKDLPATWAEFAKTAEDTEQHYIGGGAVVERVDIDPQTFPGWCTNHGYGVNASARHRFADRIAKQRHGNGGDS
jgi:hypothetical protein